MKLLLNFAEADPIGRQGLNKLLALAVGTEFKRTRDRVRNDDGGVKNWIGDGMSDVAVELPRIGEGHPMAEEFGFAVIEELRQETAEIRMEFGI
jgi:hypothetical protein